MHPLISSETDEDAMTPLTYDCLRHSCLQSEPPQIQVASKGIGEF
jgi:hypothetical protein